MSSAETAIAVLVNTTPVIVFTDPKKADELFAHIEQEIATFEYDLGSDKGRKAVASLAYKVSRTKTAIDDAGAELIEEAQKTVKSVNVERKSFRDRLDALRDKARKPLDDWEAAEARRKLQCESAIADIKAAGQILVEDTSETVAARLADMQDFDIGCDGFGDFYDIAIDARKAAIESLVSAGERLKREEADRAELERLRAENAERVRVAAEAARVQAEADAQAERERQAEERRKADEAAAAQREAAAAEAARQEEARKAQAASEAQQRAHEAAIAEAEREKADLIAAQEREKAERDAAEQDAADRIAAAERQAKEADERAARQIAEAEENARIKADQERKFQEARVKQEEADQRARAADQAHRGNIMRASKEAIMEAAGIGEDKAKKIVLAIAAGQIPNITIKF